jgi:hypothetical protein
VFDGYKKYISVIPDKNDRKTIQPLYILIQKLGKCKLTPQGGSKYNMIRSFETIPDCV